MRHALLCQAKYLVLLGSGPPDRAKGDLKGKKRAEADTAWFKPPPIAMRLLLTMDEYTPRILFTKEPQEILNSNQNRA